MDSIKQTKYPWWKIQSEMLHMILKKWKLKI
jgi:hypothetical protein